MPVTITNNSCVGAVVQVQITNARHNICMSQNEMMLQRPVRWNCDAYNQCARGAMRRLQGLQRFSLYPDRPRRRWAHVGGRQRVYTLAVELQEMVRIVILVENFCDGVLSQMTYLQRIFVSFEFFSLEYNQLTRLYPPRSRVDRALAIVLWMASYAYLLLHSIRPVRE